MISLHAKHLYGTHARIGTGYICLRTLNLRVSTPTNQRHEPYLGHRLGISTGKIATMR